MGITQYSPIPNQQVIQQYQPQDFRYLIASGEQKQHAYDEAQAFDQNADSGMGKFAVRNVDVARRDQLHGEYVQKAQELVNTKYQGDYGAAMPELKKLANGYAGNEFFSRATSALGRQKDMYETEKRIQEKGGSSLAFNRDAYSKPVYNKDGTYNDVDFDVQQRLDWAKPKMDLMKDIAKDSSISGLGYANIAGMLEHGKTTGITGQKVAAVAGRMLEPYLSTPEGAQEMRYYTNGGHTREYAMGMMMRSLGGIGSKQIGMDRDMSFTSDPLAREKYKAAQDAKQLMEGPEFSTGMMTNANAPQKMAVDEDGRPYVVNTKAAAYNAGEEVSGGSGGGIGSTSANGDNTRDYTRANQRLTEMRSSYNKIHKGEPGYNAAIGDKELVKLHNAAVDKSGELAVRGVQLMPTAAEATSSMLLGPNWKKGDISGLQGRLMMPVSTTGAGGSLVTLPEAMKEFGLSDKSKISSANVVGRNPYSPIPGAYTVRLTITDEHGRNPQTKEMLVAGSKQEQDFQGQFQPLIDAAMAGKSGRVDVGDVHLRSISAPGKDGQFHHQVRSYETLSNGEYVPMRERNPNGTIKKDAKGRPVYAKPQSLNAFTNDMYSVFQKAHPDLFNVAGFMAKDEKQQIDLSEE